MSINYKVLFSSFILGMFLSGCVLRYENVSNDSKYKPLLKTCYSLKTEMLINGVNLPPGYGKDINIYSVNPIWPKVVGREIITEDLLDLETTLEIQNIRRSINHLPGYQSIQAIVQVAPFTKSVDVPIVIDMEYIRSDIYMKRCNKNGIGAQP
jgi:hypothetical protein